MKAVADNTQEINWQAKYLEQIDARLANLEHGQVDLNAKVDRVREELRGEIREVRNLVLGMFAFVVTAVVGAVVKTFL